MQDGKDWLCSTWLAQLIDPVEEYATRAFPDMILFISSVKTLLLPPTILPMS
jgi:hypothetical protein